MNVRQNLHNFNPGISIQRTGWFITKKQLIIRYNCSGYGCPLLLSPADMEWELI